MAVKSAISIALGQSGRGKRMPLETNRPAGQVQAFPPRRNYASLSIKDLLDAREAYHVYLSTVENVVATAIGRYYIHEDDWYAEHPPDRPRPKRVPRIHKPRTLANSVIRPWSWPAVLVFVQEWQRLQELGENSIPRTLYLPDGRMAPTCIIEATPDELPPPPAFGPFHTSSLLGGGYSCLRDHQGEQSTGTIACLVRKGGSYYALTNRHVAGGTGELVKAYIRNQYERIGETASFAVDRASMAKIFPAWGGERTLLTLDAGLIRIDDINDWTSQAFGIGEIGDLFDATKQSVTLDLIGSPVRAFGGTTGVAEGEVRALFFRYESVNGYEHATDLLIGPRRNDNHARIKNPPVEHPFTRPGDSGTLWFYDPPANPQPDDQADADFGPAPVAERGLHARRLRPIAMQWGGQRVALPDGSKSAYALGTFLSSICRSLDIEVLRNWSLGHDEYWGKIGHFAVGWKACDRLSGTLSDLMLVNQARIGFPDETISQGTAFRVGRAGFVPLADVPDYVWVASKARPNEPIQHFADIDIYDIDGGPPLLDQCVADPKNVAASVWKAYFDGFAAKGVGPEDGVLPLRVWQIWEAMVAYLKKDRDAMRFVAAAGVLAHYVGDASQPLHCSYMHHGIPPMVKVGTRKYPVPRDSPEFDAFKKTAAAKIHGIYEETMLEVDTATALANIDQALKGAGPKIQIKDGHDAGVAVIQLMSRSQKRLAPKTIISADDPTLTAKARAQGLWKNAKIRNATTASLADSVRVLAALWSSAWEIGGGDSVAKAKIREYTEEELEPVYRTEKTFVPSLSLDQMAKSGDFEP